MRKSEKLLQRIVLDSIHLQCLRCDVNNESKQPLLCFFWLTESYSTTVLVLLQFIPNMQRILLKPTFRFQAKKIIESYFMINLHVVVRKKIFSWTVSTKALASRDLSHTHLVTNLLYISDCLQIPGHACNKVLIEMCTLMKHIQTSHIQTYIISMGEQFSGG